MDGKHVEIICPEHSGSAYFNYKSFYSIILLALVSATYKFLIVDIGAQGRHSDGGIFKNSIMGQRFYNNTMNLPEPSPISNRHTVPYVIVVDEAFQLQTFTMRPYPSKNLNKEQRIFNYRLSRARRVVENAFGILTSRWRIYQKPINTSLETVDVIIKVTICLHNLLMNESFYCVASYADRTSINGEILEGDWRRKNFNCFNDANNRSFASNNYTRRANEIRNIFTDYFMNEGQVPWQDEVIFKN